MKEKYTPLVAYIPEIIKKKLPRDWIEVDNAN